MMYIVLFRLPSKAIITGKTREDRKAAAKFSTIARKFYKKLNELAVNIEVGYILPETNREEFEKLVEEVKEDYSELEKFIQENRVSARDTNITGRLVIRLLPLQDTTIPELKSHYSTHLRKIVDELMEYKNRRLGNKRIQKIREKISHLRSVAEDFGINPVELDTVEKAIKIIEFVEKGYMDRNAAAADVLLSAVAIKSTR